MCIANSPESTFFIPQDADFPGATSDESSAASELTNTATPTSTRNMPTTASAPPMGPSPPSLKVISSVSEAKNPTDEQLREAVTELIDAAPTVEDVTVREVRMFRSTHLRITPGTGANNDNFLEWTVL